MTTSKAVCIAGMHRSGTSMITRLLNLAGVYLGPETDLVGPAQDNAEGFWENVHFARINNAVLEYLGGAWDVMPAFPEGWWQNPSLTPLYDEAKTLVADGFVTQAVWGWKDPRSSLTLPFWQTVVPDLQVLICLRNPLEVVGSLQRRAYASKLFSLRLWETYNRQILNNIRPENRVVTHYDAYFYEPQAELERICKAFGFDFSSEVLAKACQAVLPDLRHNRATASQPDTDPLYITVFELYDELCKAAGPIYQQALVAEPTIVNNNISKPNDKLVVPSELQRLQAEKAELQEKYQSVENRLQTLEQQNKVLQTNLTDAGWRLTEAQRQAALLTEKLDLFEHDLRALQNTRTVRASRRASLLLNSIITKVKQNDNQSTE